MGFRPSWAIALPEVDTKDAERFLLPYALTLHCHVDWLALLSRLYSEAEGLGLGLLPRRARSVGRRLLEAGLLSRKFFCILLTEHRNRAFDPVNIDPVAPAKARVLFEEGHHLLLVMSKQGGVVNELEASNLALQEG